MATEKHLATPIPTGAPIQTRFLSQQILTRDNAKMAATIAGLIYLGYALGQYKHSEGPLQYADTKIRQGVNAIKQSLFASHKEEKTTSCSIPATLKTNREPLLHDDTDLVSDEEARSIKEETKEGKEPSSQGWLSYLTLGKFGS